MNGAYSWIKANACACGKMATHYAERPLTPRDTQMTRAYLCDECLPIWWAEFAPKTTEVK